MIEISKIKLFTKEYFEKDIFKILVESVEDFSFTEIHISFKDSLFDNVETYGRETLKFLKRILNEKKIDKNSITIFYSLDESIEDKDTIKIEFN